MTKLSTESQVLTIQEKLALGAARLKERYSQYPSYAKHAAAWSDPEKYWETLAASNFNSWQLPPLNEPSIPKA